jgi:ABC-type glycerol-3-phosphate transport system permease component
MSSGVPDVIPFFNAYGVDFAPLIVGTVPFILPIVFVYLLDQRHIFGGIVKGAM